MITRVRVKNYRSLADIDVTLSPLTVLVGRNGAGKSAFLDVLRFVRDALCFNLETAINQRGGFDALRCQWSEMVDEIEVRLNVESAKAGIEGEYLVRFGVQNVSDLVIKQERCSISGLHSNGETSFETKDGIWITSPFPPTSEPVKTFPTASLVLPLFALLEPNPFAVFQKIISDISVYSLFSPSLREPQRVTSTNPLDESGENLNHILGSMLQAEKPGTTGIANRMPDLRSTLLRLTGDITDIKVDLTAGYQITQLKHEENGNESWFPLAQESDGTVRMLAILTALYQNMPPGLLCIEEPEIAIYAEHLEMLGEIIKEASLTRQVIITTQSPDLIAFFKPEDLRIVERHNGRTNIGLLSEHQREILNRELFSTSDLLRIQGLQTSPQIVPDEVHA